MSGKIWGEVLFGLSRFVGSLGVRGRREGRIGEGLLNRGAELSLGARSPTASSG